MDTSVNAANQVVSVGADIAFDVDPKFYACLVRCESSSVQTTLPTAYDVYPLDGRHDGGYYTVKDCVTIDVLPRKPGNNVFFQAEVGIRVLTVTGVQTCALPIFPGRSCTLWTTDRGTGQGKRRSGGERGGRRPCSFFPATAGRGRRWPRGSPRRCRTGPG